MINKISQNRKLKAIDSLFTNPNYFKVTGLIENKPIKKHMIKVAKKVLNNFTIIPEVFPTFRGTIQFEFEYENIYLEFELIRKTKKEYILEWFKMIDNKKVSVGIISSRDYEQMNKLVVDTFADICF